MNPVREAGKEYLMLNNSEEDSKITRMENSQQENGKPRKVRKKDIIAKMTTGKGRGIPKITGKGCPYFQRKRDFFGHTLSLAKFKSFVQINQKIISARPTLDPGTLTNRKGGERLGKRRDG